MKVGASERRRALEHRPAALISAHPFGGRHRRHFIGTTQTRRLASTQSNHDPEVKMPVKLSSRLCQPTALGRRLRVTVIALALSAIGLGAGASPSLASTGSVYFDNNGNAAAGGVLFSDLSTGLANTGVGQTALNNLTTGSANTENGLDALYSTTTGGNNVAAAPGRSSRTRLGV